ncbi:MULTISPECIES: glycosyltransferase family 2 protein [Microbacterium]|uniref:glycosyltransferase n=1 Tax=Microbacterium TaxID=33882 RepID=UPI000D657A07|nr:MULTISPECIES: glycosyltransferase family 2 protein [Microbacterium]
MPGPVSVVVPAHNESTTIARLLRRLLDTDPDDRLDIVVVANGCTDDTAAIAAAVSPRVRVVEVAAASKIAALNAGDAAAHAFPRVYLDADAIVTGEALLAAADALHDPPYASAPRMRIDTRGASIWVRWQYAVWECTDYRRGDMIGSGVYVLSEAARARFGPFPDVISDDGFVLRHFPGAERVVLPEATFTITAPRTLRAFIRRQARILAGNEELATRFPALPGEPSAGGTRALFTRVLRTPSLWLPAVPYAVARVAARRQAAKVRGDWSRQGWNRDESTRAAQTER